MTASRSYLHGDYLEPADRRPDSVVYCGFCDGFCLPQHIYDEHEMDQNFARLNAGRRALVRTRRAVDRPGGNAPNYLDGTADPIWPGPPPPQE
jgi:hypothetical protein